MSFEKTKLHFFPSSSIAWYSNAFQGSFLLGLQNSLVRDLIHWRARWKRRQRSGLAKNIASNPGKPRAEVSPQKCTSFQNICCQ